MTQTLDFQYLLQRELGLVGNDAQQLVRRRPWQRERVQFLPQTNALFGAAERRRLQGDLLLTLDQALLLLVLGLGAPIGERARIRDCAVIGPLFDHACSCEIRTGR